MSDIELGEPNSTNITWDFEYSGVNPVTASILTGVIGAISTLIQVLALSVIRHNASLGPEVKLYFYAELSCRIMILLEHIGWGIPCGLWNVREAAPLFDQVITYLHYCQFYIICFVQLGVSYNRLLAVIFDGFYYEKQRIDWRAKLFCIIFPPALIYAPVFIDKWYVATFDTYFFAFIVFPIADDPRLREWLSVYFVVVCFYLVVSIWVISILIDALVLVLVMMKFKSRSRHSIEIRLTFMTAINHSANVIGVSAGCFVTFMRLDSWKVFLCVTLINLVLYGVFALNILLFLRDKPTKMKWFSMSKSGASITMVS